MPDGSGVSIREARSGDLERLRLMAAEAVAPEVVATGGRFDEESSGEALGADVVFVADAGSHLAGYAAVCERGETLVVDQLVIAVTDEGRGVGHRLLDWVEGYGTSRGLRIVSIRVEPDNRLAREFYARRGYLPAGGALERELVHV